MFNIGYQMQQHESKLLDTIVKSNDSKSEFMQGLIAGGKEAQRERIIKWQQKIKERNLEQQKSRKK